MVYGCGNKCVKYLVFLFNFLVFVIGIAVLALSLSVRFSNDVQKYFQGLLDNTSSAVNLNQMYIALYVLAAVGAFLILTGFLGCCGAWCENTCLLAVFFSIILILFVAELGCGIAILVKKDSFKQSIFDEITKKMKEYGSWTPEMKKQFNQTQIDLKCCGCNNITDYGSSISEGAITCTLYVPQYVATGCCNKVWDTLQNQMAIVGGVSIGILVIELLAMIFSCILCQAFRRGDYQYA